MYTKKCPKCRFDIPSDASACGFCGLNIAAYQEQQHQERLADAQRFGFITYPIAIVAALAMAAWVFTWEITWGWKLLWLVLLPAAAGAIAFEWALPVLGLILVLVLVLGGLAAMG